MSQRVVDFNAGEKIEERVLLTDITVSHNPRASLRGVLDRFHSEGASANPPESRQAFVTYMTQDHPEIDSLRRSIETHGLLQPPVVRAFRVKQGDVYVQRYGIVLGEGRVLAHAIIEASTGVAQRVRVRVETRLGVDAAFEQGLAENLDRNDMNPVDLAQAFHEMLTVRVNPATRSELVAGEPNPLYSSDAPKGRPYTLKEVAARVGRSYWWVRDHEAVFYLPDQLKEQCIRSWQAGKRDVTKFCKLGLQYKAKAGGSDPDSALDSHTTTTHNPAPVRAAAVLGVRAVRDLFDATSLENLVRLQTLAEVMGVDLDTALRESGERKSRPSRDRKAD